MVKLLAFLAVGIFVSFGVFDGLGDLFSRAAANPELQRLMTMESTGGNWVTLTLLAMSAIIFLPRQFQVAVVENTSEDHLNKAIWMFPLYLLVINIFVLPIAFGGLLQFPDGSVDADTFVLALPMAEQKPWLALFVFIGGLSAATGMVIVATIALSTMICNDLVMPMLFRFAGLHLADSKDLSSLLLGIRRSAIIIIILLGYIYFRLIGDSYALVTIGLVSFTAVAQFAPAIIGGIYWKGASQNGAITGLTAGFLVWAYTLVLPSFARSGWLPESFIENGAFGIALLKPYALFGLEGLDTISHALFWSMLANIGSYIAVSLVSRQSAIERIQGTLFVDVYRPTSEGTGASQWLGTALVADLKGLALRFAGRKRAAESFDDYAARRGISLDETAEADAGLIRHTERLLAGVIGAASARVMVASVVKGEDVVLEEIMEILDETSQVLEYSRRLEQKSKALEAATEEIKRANLRLQELDKLKDEFLSTVTHELRTPLTSIRSFSEILHDNPDVEAGERAKFLGIIIRESERLTRLINQVLDLTKIEAGRMEWCMEEVDLSRVIEDSVATMANIFEERNVSLEVLTTDDVRPVRGDRDHLTQVVLNLLSNAEKFCRHNTGQVTVTLYTANDAQVVSVRDNGPGISFEDQKKVFDKFHQISDGEGGNPTGSGLGLTITQRIIEHLGGRVWVDSEPGQGATFSFSIPVVEN